MHALNSDFPIALEPTAEDWIIFRRSDSCGLKIHPPEHSFEIGRHGVLLIVFLSSISFLVCCTFSDVELCSISVSFFPCLNTSLELPDDFFPSVGVNRCNLVDLAIGHVDNAMSEILQADVVGHHNHRNALLLIQIN